MLWLALSAADHAKLSLDEIVEDPIPDVIG